MSAQEPFLVDDSGDDVAEAAEVERFKERVDKVVKREADEALLAKFVNKCSKCALYHKTDDASCSTFTYSGPIDDNLVDPITLEPFVDAKSLPCGHVLSDSSVKQIWSSATKTCPTCRSPFDLKDVHPLFLVRSFTDKLLVSCPHCRGQVAPMERQQLATHLKTTCEFWTTACGRCNRVGPRRFMAAHKCINPAIGSALNPNSLDSILRSPNCSMVEMHGPSRRVACVKQQNGVHEVVVYPFNQPPYRVVTITKPINSIRFNATGTMLACVYPKFFEVWSIGNVYKKPFRVIFATVQQIIWRVFFDFDGDLLLIFHDGSIIRCPTGVPAAPVPAPAPVPAASASLSSSAPPASNLPVFQRLANAHAASAKTAASAAPAPSSASVKRPTIVYHGDLAQSPPAKRVAN